MQVCGEHKLDAFHNNESVLQAKRKLTTERIGVMVTLYICILEVFASNLRQKTDQAGGLFGFHNSLQETAGTVP
jgi:hypothetical protein